MRPFKMEEEKRQKETRPCFVYKGQNVYANGDVLSVHIGFMQVRFKSSLVYEIKAFIDMATDDIEATKKFRGTDGLLPSVKQVKKVKPLIPKKKKTS